MSLKKDLQAKYDKRRQEVQKELEEYKALFFEEVKKTAAEIKKGKHRDYHIRELEKMEKEVKETSANHPSELSKIQERIEEYKERIKQIKDECTVLNIAEKDNVPPLPARYDKSEKMSEYLLGPDASRDSKNFTRVISEFYGAMMSVVGSPLIYNDEGDKVWYWAAEDEDKAEKTVRKRIEKCGIYIEAAHNQHKIMLELFHELFRSDDEHNAEKVLKTAKELVKEYEKYISLVYTHEKSNCKLGCLEYPHRGEFNPTKDHYGARKELRNLEAISCTLEKDVKLGWRPEGDNEYRKELVVISEKLKELSDNKLSI